MFCQNFPRSKNQIKKMGKALKRHEPHDEELYKEWMTWNAQLLDSTAKALEHCLDEFIAGELPPILDSIPPLDREAFERSGRVKTEDTTREKLKRNTTSLDRIQDIIGLRIDGPLTLDQQTRLASHIEAGLQAKGGEVAVKDLRDGSHCGYRAVHLHVTFPAGRTEIQIRTSYQSVWANMYEVMADVAGREIRYKQAFSEGTERRYGALVREFWRVSEALYDLETAWSHCVSTWEETMLKLQQVSEPIPEALQVELDRAACELKSMHEGREELVERFKNLEGIIRILSPLNHQEGDV